MKKWHGFFVSLGVVCMVVITTGLSLAAVAGGQGDPLTIPATCFSGVHATQFPGDTNTSGVRWDDHPGKPNLICNTNVIDVSSYDTVTFELYSGGAVDTGVAFILMSDNPETSGADYYYASPIRLDWEGTRSFSYALDALWTSRSPLGLDAIGRIEFWAAAFGNVPQDEAELIVTDITFSKSVGGTTWRDDLTNADASSILIPPDCFGLSSTSNREGAVWNNHPTVGRLVCDLNTADLSGFSGVRFILDSAVDNYAGLVVLARSENPSTDGDDYYLVHLTVDWSGPKQFDIPFEQFEKVRTPLGWGAIEALELWARGWKNVPEADTSIIVSDIELYR